MSDDAKNEVAAVLEFLRSTLIGNHLSMGMDGFAVDIDSLVK